MGRSRSLADQGTGEALRFVANQWLGIIVRIDQLPCVLGLLIRHRKPEQALQGQLPTPPIKSRPTSCTLMPSLASIPTSIFISSRFFRFVDTPHQSFSPGNPASLLAMNLQHEADRLAAHLAVLDVL